MSESALWKWTKSARDLQGVHALWMGERSWKRGVLDSEWCAWGVPFWLELKSADEPARSSSLVLCERLKPQQVDFLLDRTAAGGEAWILYRVGRGRVIVDGRLAELVAPRPTLGTLRDVGVSVTRPVDVLREIVDAARGRERPTEFY